MAKRLNSPLKTLFLLLVTAGLAYAGYEYLYVRRILQVEKAEYIPLDKLHEAREAIIDAFGQDPCLNEVGAVYYRPKENRYRADVTISDGCRDEARRLCEEISDLASDVVSRDVDVFAYYPGSSLAARFLR